MNYKKLEKDNKKKREKELLQKQKISIGKREKRLAEGKTIRNEMEQNWKLLEEHQVN